MTAKSGLSPDHAEALTARLRSAVKGTVLQMGDGDYERACTVYHGGLQQRPAVVVRPAEVGDVVTVVNEARQSDAPLTVKGGGHSWFCLSDGGILLDLSSLQDIDIDAEARTAWAGGGTTAAQYTTRAQEHGLATGFGDTGSVGIAGITLGGGIGYLARKFGLTMDDLLAAEVVTADGEVRIVDVENDPDLFWALRGGGGNFGVVTRLQLRLHEVGTIHGGLLVLPATAETISGFVELAEKAPRELSAIADIFAAPPLPFVPQEWLGKPIMMNTMVFAGDPAVAEEVLAPFRALATPIADMLAPMPYADLYPSEEDEWHPVSAARNLFTDELGREAAALIVDRIGSSTAELAAVQVRVLGGAVIDGPADSAFAHRHRRMMLNIAAVYSNPDDAQEHTRWSDELLQVLQQGGPGVYVNFLADDSLARIREAYPDQVWERLREVKRKYDLENLFRINNNIPPAGTEKA